jgi:hypothetical protein
MKKALMSALALVVAGCGSHMNIEIQKATAVREASDFVTVQAELACSNAGYGEDCAAAGQYCVEATWKKGTETVATAAKVCSTYVIARMSDSETLVLISDKAIAKPADGIDIEVKLTSAVSEPGGQPHEETRTISSP